MKAKEYNFDKAKRGAVVPAPSPSHKTRITIRIDTDILNWFRSQVHKAGGGNYQTLINEALREYVQHRAANFETTLRRIIREELHPRATKARAGRKSVIKQAVPA
ncbi:MAG: BrnA antitoxin family protein [candidate division KSB1 bacterium]|nr:BrnA antitoxin family protein [candidate division KSB1 bacterium]MDZ7301395.1 BrnA antitoxin family protein [candidate division KSB1 bacterium]MDZ7310720.1 BrnA antitoxin family protein [candidate division KSB1 bacterium]